MANEARQLRRIERQLRVAAVRRREAIAALADEVAQETRSANLVTRSRALAAGGPGLRDATSGSEVSQRGGFSGALAAIACDAQKAVDAARDRRENAAEVLAARGRRFDRIEDLARIQKRKAEHSRQMRETTQASDLARGLQSEAQNRLQTSLSKSAHSAGLRRVR